MLYFNRVFASLVSWGIRTYTWHRYQIYIDIQALQISLLAGRIFFTGLRYHGNNETILVQNGHITWAYWLRRVREVQIGKNKAARQDDDGAPADHLTKLPCRVKVSLMGLEWFIYNRSPAYDSVLAGLDKSDPVANNTRERDVQTETVPGSTLKLRKRRQDRPTKIDGATRAMSSASREKNSGSSDRPCSPVAGHPSSLRSSASETDDRERNGSDHAAQYESQLPLFLQLLPIHIECEKAALVMGNENTRAVLIIKADTLSGEVDASETKTPDPYRQYFRFKFNHPVIEMRENPDYKEDQAARAARDKHIPQGPLASPPKRSFLRWQRHRLHAGLRRLIPFLNPSVESLSSSDRDIDTATGQVPPSGQWQGLSRYLSDDTEDQRSRWASCEYAAVPTLLDSPEASLTIFWDVAGKVAPGLGENASGRALNINGAEPPAWSITLSIHGGSINYGPWADRHRAELQRIFVPSLCKDAVPASPLPPGAFRMPTQFTFYVELTDVTTIRIPTKEESKNWRWKGKESVSKKLQSHDTRRARRSKKSDQPADVHSRPYGWLDIKVPSNSTASYSMDMVAGPSGYTVTLEVDFPTTEITSSINHEVLWRSGRQRISCDLSTPLSWNGLRQWHFNISSNELELYLLRDHVFLLTDVVDDWATGPPTEYLVFTPFKYHLNFQLHDVKLFLNLNDANIINNPTDPEDNTYLIISSPLLRIKTCIPIDEYRPMRNTIPYDIRADTVSFDLHVPPWNTQASFLSSKEVGRLETLVIEGTYHYNATISPGNIDTLVVNVTGQSLVATFYGFTIRYFLKVKDNYFGEDIHFKTLEEYQESLRLKETDPAAELANRPPPKKSNDLDVILSVRTDDPKIILPANLYSSQRHIQIDTASLCLDLRLTNYYMDMDLVVAPLNFSLGHTGSGAETPMSSTSSTQMFIDGLHVYGHRLFGLPPTEPTYMCNWDLSAGALTGECTVEFLTTLVNAGKSFAFSFDDDENALIPASALIVYDITFFRAHVHSVRLWLHVEDAAFLLSTGTINLRYNDWARSHYSKRAVINIPDVKVSCLNAESATRHKSRSSRQVEADALVETSVRLAVITRKAHFSAERKLQQDLVRASDQRTRRTHFLILPELVADGQLPSNVEPASQSIPPMPTPLKPEELTGGDGASFISSVSSNRFQGLRRQSSFLSFSSSSQRSVRKPLSSKRSSKKELTSEQGSARFGDDGSTPWEHASLARQSLYHRTSGETVDYQDAAHNTVAFSSQYFAPYFPLEHVRPSHQDAMMQTIEDDEADLIKFELADIDPTSLDEDFAYSAVVLELPPGLNMFCNPTSLRYVAALLSSLQCLDPDNILDSLQIDSMKEIFDMQKDQTMKGRISDFMVKLPQVNLRLVNPASLDSLDQATDEHDQYDVVLKKLSFMSRIHTTWQDPFKAASRQARNAFHLRLASIEIAATERLQGVGNPQAAASARVENVIAFGDTRDATSLYLEVDAIGASTSSGKVDSLASLIHRASLLGADLGKLFSETSSQEKMVTRNLVRHLIAKKQETPDPSFLVRPSAVLRSATQHLRTFDSWKLIMRLRQMWTVLEATEAEELLASCFTPPTISLVQAKKEVLSAFEGWRSWDLDNIEESVFVNLIFGNGVDRSASSATNKPTFVAAKIKQLQLALNPGPKQNGIILLDLAIRVQLEPPSDQHLGEGLPPNIASNIINVSCGNATVSLNWELCELAENILNLVERIDSQSLSESLPTSSDVNQTKTVAHSLSETTTHCVVVLDHGSLIIEAINLYSESFADHARASLLVKRGANNATDTNLILSCDSVSSSLRSHHQKLAKLSLEMPSVFASHELRASETTDSHTIKATASNQYMSLMVKQDPITLAEVLDLLVRDELAQLSQLKKQLPSLLMTPAAPKNIKDRLTAFRVNVALFMDRYTITIPLLRSLTYTVHGTVSRAAIAANFGREIIFDFDIKENSHDIQIQANNVSRSISLLQIPPTSGRIRSHIDHEEHMVSVFASVELVQLDVGAVYSLLSALNRPEISSAMSELQEQIKIIEEHIKEVTGHEDLQLEKGSPRSNQSTLVYAVHLTLAGIEIFGETPLTSDTTALAHISFSLDSIHLSLANRVEQHGPTLTYPELNLNLRRISCQFKRGAAGAMTCCGSVVFGALITASSRPNEDGKEERFFHVRSDTFEADLSPATVSTAVDVLGYMNDRFKDLDTSKELEYLRRFKQSKPRIAVNNGEPGTETDIIDAFLSSITYSFEFCNIQLAWLVTDKDDILTPGSEDLVLSLARIELGTRTRNSARLAIENLQLQMVRPSHDKRLRSPNSALLPEVIFNVAYVSTADIRRLAFQAVGKPLDVRLTSGFIIPAAHLNDSINWSLQKVQQASQNWSPIVSSPPPEAVNLQSEEQLERKNFIGGKRLESLLIDADFAGAVVHLTGQKPSREWIPHHRPARPSSSGKQGHFSADETASSTTLRSPGLAFKLEFRDNGKDDPSLHAEIKIDASSNTIYPSVVPLIVEISDSIKKIVSSSDEGTERKPSLKARDVAARVKLPEEDNILATDPTTMLGRVRLNLGLRICRQEFSLSCQPIARVAATASFDSVYFIANTVRSTDQGNFFAVSGIFTHLQASVQHVYSRESTGSFKVESIVLSLLNSKHLSGTSGLSAILKVSPMEVSINAKQLQDFLLFREIWIPSNKVDPTAHPVAKLVTETSQGHLVQRYQQVAATAAFPWTASISIEALKIVVDLGQSLGKSTFSIQDFWVASKKTSDWEQNLCLGFRMIGVESTGRMSGFVALEDFKLRTWINWPEREQALNETPLIQASVGIRQLRVKAAFDYQAFLVADIRSLEFLMYNVRRSRKGSGDKLKAVFIGDAVQIFGTTTSSSQGVALYQAFKRLIQERKANFETSLKEIERYLQRKSVSAPSDVIELLKAAKSNVKDDNVVKSPISLDTDVAVTLKALNLGVFPSSFSDHQVFKMEALNAQARFAASVIDDGRIHSILGLTLGQLRIGLASVRSPASPRTLGELSVEDVVQSATGSRGGTILKVPKVEAVMQTWQRNDSKRIDYIFKSAFEGKVEVGWNYSRISYIRGMWANHTKTLAQTWGRELPNVTAIRVTGVGLSPDDEGKGKVKEKETEKQKDNKITAEVNVPVSKYEYVALEPPIIETPQLRDMGEATPPLEWIGLHREKLPNLTHQIVIVALLELAGEVEDAYSKILGSS